MIRLWPTPAEAASLRFVVPRPELRLRLALAAALFATGIALWCLVPPLAVFGLVLILAGHLPLWVHRQTTAPGGATPKHEEVWAPVEESWLKRIEELERRGEAWDTTPWDISNGIGCTTLVLALVLGFAGAIAAGIRLGAFAMIELAVPALFLLLPLWLNGMRSTWHPSELRKKGQALAVAQEAVKEAKDFEPVPMLALREGRRGPYPVDARLLLRPAGGEDTRFLGVQVQVSMNNVRGTDYPYLYAVVLGKTPFRLPPAQGRHQRPGGHVSLVHERGQNEGVDFLVVRQHADTQGGWHTEPAQIHEIVTAALDEARSARDDNREERR